MQKEHISLLLFILISGLASCGGGGGYVDVTPPSMPVGLITAPTSSSSIELNWDVSTDNVGVAGYKIYRNGVEISTATANEFRDTGLLSSTTYTYTVSAYDATRNDSAQSAAISTSTLPPAGTSVETSLIASDIGLAPAYPRIAGDASGDSYVLWRQAAGYIDIIVTAQSNSAGVWSAATTLMPSNIGSALTHDIGANRSGDAMAVWDLYDGVSSHIWANKYVAGTGWAGAVQVDSATAVDVIDPAVAVDVNGNAIAVWRQSDGTNYKVWANRFVAGTGWGTSELIDTDTGGFDDYPQIAFDSGGNAIAVWLRQDGSAHSIRARRYRYNIGWDSVISILSIKQGYSEGPRIAIDGAGNAFVVWNQVNVYPVISTWSSRYVSGAGWETASVIETDDRGYTYRARIAVTPGGDALAAWEQSDGTRYNIVVNQYIAGTGWGAAWIISSSNGQATQWPAIAVNDAGDAVVAWEQYSSQPYSQKICAAKYYAGEGWSSERTIQVNGDAVYPELVMDQDGYTSVVWEQYQNDKVDIWGARFR